MSGPRVGACYSETVILELFVILDSPGCSTVWLTYQLETGCLTASSLTVARQPQ